MEEENAIGPLWKNKFVRQYSILRYIEITEEIASSRLRNAEVARQFCMHRSDEITKEENAIRCLWIAEAVRRYSVLKLVEQTEEIASNHSRNADVSRQYHMYRSVKITGEENAILRYQNANVARH